jgi:gliding motility-associated-like protein
MQLFGLEQIELIKELSIFNRWGELIYQIKNQDASLQSDFWDGSFKGSPVNPGVYIFIAEFKSKDQQIIKYSGDINLIR